MSTKVCRKCWTEKQIEEFHMDASKRDGHCGTCKECARSRAAAWHSANPEKAKANYDAWVAKNPDRVKAHKAKWVAKNPEKMKACIAAWGQANPEKRKAGCRNRRSRKRGNGGTHTAADVQNLLMLQRKKCAACRESIAKGYHVDHMVPLALGGSNDKSNLQLLCPTCNLKKNVKHPIEFMRQYGFLL